MREKWKKKRSRRLRRKRRKMRARSSACNLYETFFFSSPTSSFRVNASHFLNLSPLAARWATTTIATTPCNLPSPTPSSKHPSRHQIETDHPSVTRVIHMFASYRWMDIVVFGLYKASFMSCIQNNDICLPDCYHDCASSVSSFTRRRRGTHTLFGLHDQPHILVV
jgi:hypothetical protein